MGLHCGAQIIIRMQPMRKSSPKRGGESVESKIEVSPKEKALLY